MRLEFTDQARRDLADVKAYIAEASGYEDYATRFILKVMRSCENLIANPELGRRREDLLPRLRVIPVEKRAMIVYRIDGDAVVVGGIFYAGRDYETIVRERGEGTF